MAGVGDCEIYQESKETIAEIYLVRHVPEIQQVLEGGDLRNVFRPAGLGNPADGARSAPSGYFEPPEGGLL